MASARNDAVSDARPGATLDVRGFEAFVVEHVPGPGPGPVAAAS